MQNNYGNHKKFFFRTSVASSSCPYSSCAARMLSRTYQATACLGGAVFQAGSKGYSRIADSHSNWFSVSVAIFAERNKGIIMEPQPTEYFLNNQPKLDSNYTVGRFAGQVIVITGGGGGMGSSAAVRFLNDGATVALVDRNPEQGASVLKELGERFSGKAAFYICDISKRSECFRIANNIFTDFGKINHLVNAATLLLPSGLDMDEENLRKTMGTNVGGYGFMAQACYPFMSMISQNENCSVVNVSSAAANQVQKNRWAFSASKGAINSMTKCMAAEFAVSKVRVNSISPAWIFAPSFQAANPGAREKWEPIYGKYHLVNRFGELAECAAAITFLCSSDASFITATDLKVDGGYGALSAEGTGAGDLDV